MSGPLQFGSLPPLTMALPTSTQEITDRLEGVGLSSRVGTVRRTLSPPRDSPPPPIRRLLDADAHIPEDGTTEAVEEPARRPPGYSSQWMTEVLASDILRSELYSFMTSQAGEPLPRGLDTAAASTPLFGSSAPEAYVPGTSMRQIYSGPPNVSLPRVSFTNPFCGPPIVSVAPPQPLLRPMTFPSAPPVAPSACRDPFGIGNLRPLELESIQPASALPFGQRPGSLKPPAPSKWNGSRDGLEVKQFLQELHCYLAWHSISELDMGRVALLFVTGRPFRMWKNRITDLTTAGKAADFLALKQFLMESFGSVAHERQLRAKYNQLRQTTSVLAFVRETRNLKRELSDSPWPVENGELVSRFIDGLRIVERNFVQDNAPPGGWMDPDLLFEKAVNYEINRKSQDFSTNLVGRKRKFDTPVATHVLNLHAGKNFLNSNHHKFPVPGGHGQKRQLAVKRPNHRPNLHIPIEEWNKRMRANVCALCKGPHHHTQHPANAPRDLAPF